VSAFLSYTTKDFYKTVPCESVLTIGRDKGSDIILEDLMISRNHAVIRRVGVGDFYLIDGGSSNGSYVNQLRVKMPRLLKNNDKITIGGIDFLFEQEKEKSTDKSSVDMIDTIVHDTPEIKKITILVADIRGFMSLSEEIPIPTLTRMMNAWFNQVTKVIDKHDGMVDKFIGDCVFARWESDENEFHSVMNALKAAEAINKVTQELNHEFTELSEKLHIGVGINTGVASMMTMGGDDSAMGDAVNVAFRLESATKTLGKDIVLSESAYKHFPQKYWKKQEQKIRVKGKRDLVRIFAIDFDVIPGLIKDMVKKSKAKKKK